MRVCLQGGKSPLRKGGSRAVFLAGYLWALGIGVLHAQTPMTWAQIKDRFESMNPVLRAGVLGIDETRTGEVAAYLRPNPSMTITADQLDPFTLHPLRPLYNALPAGSVSYLHEREHKRELRLDSARRATEIAVEQQSDLERNLLFALKNAFVQLLQAKSVLAMARDNLNYYDDFLRISRDRLQAGDIA